MRMYQYKSLYPFTNPCCTGCTVELHLNKWTYTITQGTCTEFGIHHCHNGKQLADLDLYLDLDFEPKLSHIFIKLKLEFMKCPNTAVKMLVRDVRPIANSLPYGVYVMTLHIYNLCLQANAEMVPKFPSCYYMPLM